MFSKKTKRKGETWLEHASILQVWVPRGFTQKTSRLLGHPELPRSVGVEACEEKLASHRRVVRKEEKVLIVFAGD